MLSVALVVAGLLGAVRWLVNAKSKPVSCPNCWAKTLIADRMGQFWRCTPCQARYVWFDGELFECHDDELGSGETLPAAQLSKPRSR